MSTKVFISWSGEQSKKCAEALRLWLPCVLQHVTPYFSPEDIEKGKKWDSEITRELEDSNIGLICLTPDNTEKPWICFEAGALSKSIKHGHVCTLLFNIEPANIKGPLANFQATRFQKNDFKNLIGMINSKSDDSQLKTESLDKVFDKFWIDLEENIKNILSSHEKREEKQERPEREIIEEILERIRSMDTNNIDRRQSIHERVALIDLGRSIFRYLEEFPLNNSTKIPISHILKPLKFLFQQNEIEEEFSDLNKKFLMHGSFMQSKLIKKGKSTIHDPNYDF